MKNTKQLSIAMMLSLILLSTASVAQAEFLPVKQPPGYLHPMAISTNNISNGAKGYRPWFENGSWQGDIVEYNISASGEISTSVDLSGLEPLNSTGQENWSARLQFNEKATDYWDKSRKIITLNEAGQQVAFRWNNLSTSQKQALDSASANTDSSPILNFIRGDQSNEKPTGNLRTRYNLLGDIIHSNPIYVGAPNSNINESSYITFRNDNANRAPRIYIGSNDGMLHVFDANTGDEVYAFIPPSLIPKLNNLSSDPYSHQYFVDGELAVYDIFINEVNETNKGKWHTILVGGLGAGGTTRFALDITNPDLSSESSSTGVDKKILWLKDDLQSSTIAAGAYGQATLVKLKDKDEVIGVDGVKEPAIYNYYSINGNGYREGTGIPELILTNIATGVSTKISTGRTSTSSPYGLSTPAVYQLNIDESYNYAYAGDLDGNIWKFNLDTKKLAYTTPLFTSQVGQPITTKPSVTTHPRGGKLVFVGTGKTLLESDLSDTTTQAMYGIWDNGAPVVSNKLLQQTLSADTSISAESTEIVKTLTNTPVDWLVNSGWKVDLPNGMRVVTNHKLRAGRVQTVVTNPVTDENWLFEPTYLNGGSPYSPIFDINGDGKLDSLDNISTGTNNIVSAWKLADGIMSGPLIVSLGEGVDIKYVNYQKLPLAPLPCTEGCGFVGGHIDVDTDSTFGDDTTEHTHEYDKIVLQPYVDYFQVKQAKSSHVSVDEVTVGKKFIVVVANADLSSKSNIQIGEITYNIVEYQKMIQQKMSNWNWNNGLGNGNFTDNEGNPLVHTLASLQANGGLFRNAFDSHSILDGGLHPTETGCLRGAPSITNGRWRNGALVTQLIDINKISSLTDLYLQRPTDLPTSVMIEGKEITLKETTSGVETIYGGIRAKDSTAFLYESTLFWHAKVGCYGSSGWETAVEEARKGITEAQFDPILKDFNFTSLTELVERLQKALLDCASADDINKCLEDTIINKDGKKGKKTIKDLISKVNRLLKDDIDNITTVDELINVLEGVIDGSINGGNGGLDNGGLPIVVEGGNDSTGVTAGPNYIKGRRTWTDITNH